MVSNKHRHDYILALGSQFRLHFHFVESRFIIVSQDWFW